MKLSKGATEPWHGDVAPTAEAVHVIAQPGPNGATTQHKHAAEGTSSVSKAHNFLMSFVDSVEPYYHPIMQNSEK